MNYMEQLPYISFSLILRLIIVQCQLDQAINNSITIFQTKVQFSIFLQSSTRFINALLIFNAALQQFCYCMLVENQDCREDPLCRTDYSFQREKYSLNTTETYSIHENSLAKHQSNKLDLQRTETELPHFSSRALDFQQSFPALPMQNQINELMQRFSQIHKMFITHSQYQSSIHQKRCGFKTMSIDKTHLIPLYSNKANIIGDIAQLVQGFQMENQTKNIQQLIEIKFMEYYLERHYAGLECQSNNMSIQLKLEEKQQFYKENRQYFQEQIEGGQTFIHNQSNILMKSQYEQKKAEEVNIFIERINIIEVQIPIIVYKLKEVVVDSHSQDSFLQSKIDNIDSIISKYSKPYEDNYKDKTSSQHEYLNQQNVSQLMQQSRKQDPPESRIVASIMIDSNHRNFIQKQTQVELIYSDIPQQSNFKLPLDSFAQIESLISNQSGSSTDQYSRPPTQRDNLIPFNQEINITEKGINRSLLQRIQENQRILNEENLQLKQSITILQQKLYILQKKNKDLQMQNQKCHKRLEQQIQQTQYLSNKLDQIDAQILQEKIECLTHLNLTKDRKIEAFTLSLAQNSEKIVNLAKKLEQMQKALHLSSQQIIKKDQQIIILSKQLFQKEQQLYQIQKCENTVIQIATNSEQNLKRQVQRLQYQKCQLQEQIKQYQKRLKTQGINLEYEQAAEIQGIIQSRDYSHSLQLHDINKRYQEVITLYQDQIKQLKNQLQQINQLSKEKNYIIAQKQAKQIAIKVNNQKYFKQFQQIIKQYNEELQTKDEEILALKQKRPAEDEVQELLAKFVQTINLLENQLLHQRCQTAKMTDKYLQLSLSEQLKKQNMDDLSYEEKLIQQLTNELQKKIQQNKQIKEKLQKQSALIMKFIEDEGQTQSDLSVKKQNEKLRDINRKLKKYTLLLQQEIKTAYSVDQCQGHRKLVNSLTEQKNYFYGLATRQMNLHKQAQS